MQYNKNIETASDFIENIKDYPKQCVLLGVVIGGPYRYLPWEIENYYNTLMQSNDEYERMNDFFTAHGLAALDPSEQTKQLCKEREKIADKTRSYDITKLLWEIREKEAISEKEKEDLVKLISESTFTKFGILLSSHLSYCNK